MDRIILQVDSDIADNYIIIYKKSPKEVSAKSNKFDRLHKECKKNIILWNCVDNLQCLKLRSVVEYCRLL